MLSHTDPVAYEVKEFLPRFKISRTAFYEEVKAGRLPILKRGRKTLIDVEDAQVWFKNHRSREVAA